MAELTPMMQQYTKIKEKHKDVLLFFRLGDFYEMFGDDARTASRELDLTLTTRDRSKTNSEDKIPMCGVPFHAVETYIAKLIAKGYKVALCDQLEDPATAKGLVDRDVVRVITPGTLIESSMLDESKSNYLCSVYKLRGLMAVAFAELSTGECRVCIIEDGDLDRLYSMLSTYDPAETILIEEARNMEQLKMFLHLRLNCMVEISDDECSAEDYAEIVRRQFADGMSEPIAPAKESAANCAAGALIKYMQDTQKTELSHFRRLCVDNEGEVMEMDFATLKNLELTESLSRSEVRGSLYWVLNKMRTSMGRRLLRAWIVHPLLNERRINRRLDAVSELFEHTVARSELMREFSGMSDLERLISKTSYGAANGRDLRAIASTISHLPAVRQLLKPFESEILRRMFDMDLLTDIFERIDGTVVDEPPISVREGGIIKPGVNHELDRLRELLNDSSGALSAIEQRERERTGKKLKVGYNRVFGYYIEIPRSMSSDVPPDYIRKQTLANNERFITSELKELEDTLLTAKDRVVELEHQIFDTLRRFVAGQVGRIQLTATDISELDVLCSLAEVASKNGYCRPVITSGDRIKIVNGRHPVVELMQKDGTFVPNSTDIDNGDRQISIITGPNMAGKSTYMRQVALIALMAQIGSFVPAQSAELCICDRIFTRIGASDDLAGGRSTFMVEMTEVASILKNATGSSLVLLDEVGRGTSTYDGMAVARAVIEYFLEDREKHGAKVLFATHYHELSSMERELGSIKNYHITAKKQGDDIIFLRRIEPGCADDSYGVEVAALAGVPRRVTDRAKDILSAFHTDEPAKRMAMAQVSIFDTPPDNAMSETDSAVLSAVREARLDEMTPFKAMELLYELQRRLKDEQN